MKPILKTLPHPQNSTVIPLRPRDSRDNKSLAALLVRLDHLLLSLLQRRSITVLRFALGAIFFWFGALKLFATSPVLLLIQETYSFLPLRLFVFVLGVWEMLIGIGVIFKRALRCVLILLSLHLLGTFSALLFNPQLFFVQGFPLCLTVDGEFVMKNLVLIAAAAVIAGHEIKPLK